MEEVLRAKVSTSGDSQKITVPEAYRFATDEVFVSRDSRTVVERLSEKPPLRSMREILKDFDDLGMADFAVERDESPQPERDNG